MPTLISPTKLFEAICAGNDRMEDLRERRREAYQEFAGRYAYVDDGQARPLNLIAKAVQTFIPYMASRSPEHRFGSHRLALRGEADALGLAVTQTSRKIKRVRTTRRVLMDAFLAPFGLRRVGQRVSSEIVTIRGRDFPKGMCYDKYVDLDDYVFDPAARCQEEMLWEGEYIRVPRVDALESGIFRGFEDIIESLPSLGDGRSGTRRQERHEDLSRLGPSHPDDFELVDMIELWDGVIHDEVQPVRVTLAGSEEWSDTFLREIPYNGVCGGPFFRCEFNPVPNQPYGVAPVAHWREQSETFYSLLNKAVREILKMKTMLVGRKDQEDDLRTLQHGEDSDVALLDDPDGAKNLQVGAQIQDLTPMAELFLGMFQTQAHNPDLLAGGKSQTDKATIYQGQQASAMQIVEDMQNLHDTHEEEVSTQVAKMLIDDPLVRIPLTRRVPGGEWIEIEYAYDQREGDFFDFNFKLKPRSMQRQDQNVRSRRLIELLDGIMHATEVSMGTGGMINVQKVARILGDEFDIEELDEIVNDPMIQMMQEQLYGQSQPGAPGQPGQSPVAPGYQQGPRTSTSGGGGNGADRQRGFTSNQQASPFGASRAGRPSPAGAR